MKRQKAAAAVADGTVRQRKAKTTAEERVVITAPDIRTMEFTIVGTAPYVQHKFSAKAEQEMRSKQEAGGQSKSKKTRAPKDFTAAFEAATYTSAEGWHGIPAGAFRNAMIRACKIVGFVMEDAKIALFVAGDGEDVHCGTALVKIHGKREMDVRPARNSSGVADLRARPMWRKWSAVVRIQYDHGVFSPTDVANLLQRAGMQVGVGEGRNSSKKSAGLGWGSFALKEAP